jgi:hypothetical protein
MRTRPPFRRDRRRGTSPTTSARCRMVGRRDRSATGHESSLRSQSIRKAYPSTVRRGQRPGRNGRSLATRPSHRDDGSHVKMMGVCAGASFAELCGGGPGAVSSNSEVKKPRVCGRRRLHTRSNPSSLPREGAQYCVFERKRLSPVGSGWSLLAATVSPEQLKRFALDNLSSFLFAQIDGATDVQPLLDIAGLPRRLALRRLHALLDAPSSSSHPGGSLCSWAPKTMLVHVPLSSGPGIRRRRPNHRVGRRTVLRRRTARESMASTGTRTCRRHVAPGNLPKLREPSLARPSATTKWTS